MRFFKYILILTIVITACKSNKAVVEASDIKKISSRKIVKKHLTNVFDAKTMEAKYKVQYSDNRKGKKNKYTLSVRLRMQKDSIIWIKGTYKVLSAFRMRITPTTFSYYSPISKEYFEGDFSLLESMLGAKITYEQVQNLLLGQSIENLQEHRYTSGVDEGSHTLTPKKQNELYRIFLFFDPKNFKLKKQLLKVNDDRQSLNITYQGYITLEEQLVPKRIFIYASEGEKYTSVNMTTRSLQLNKKISTPYRIPKGYKKIVL